MKYFALVNIGTQPKNKAQTAIQKLGLSKKGTLLLQRSDIDIFAAKLSEKINKINCHNPRCTDVSSKLQEYAGYNSISFYADDCFSISFHQVKQEISYPFALNCSENDPNCFEL